MKRNTWTLLSLGGSGVISVWANVQPAECHQMVQEYLTGDQNKAREIYLKYLQVMNHLFLEVNPIPIKAAMNLMGTSSGAALIPGIIGAIVEIIVMMVVFTVLVARSRARGEVFAYGPKDTVHEGEERLPNPWLAAIPLVFTFVVFNFFKVNITVVLAVTTVLSAVLFYPQLKKHGVIMAIFSSFAVKDAFQHRVLYQLSSDDLRHCGLWVCGQFRRVLPVLGG